MIEDLLPAGLMNWFQTGMVTCLYASRLDALHDSALGSLKSSLDLHKVGTCAKCLGTIFPCTQKISLRPQLLYVDAE